MPAAIKYAILFLKDKRVRKTIAGILIALLLLFMATWSSCTGHNLQQYAQNTVSAEFAPLVNAVNSEITDGGQINAELLYASYITLFDNNQHTESEKASIRVKLVTCFYTVKTVKVADKSVTGKPVLNADGKTSYHDKTVYSAITDSARIFDKIQSKFGIAINSTERDYIIHL